MEISHSELKFSFKIEPRPGGGFIAHPSDPSMQAIEGATQEEVQQKVNAAIGQIIASRIPGLDGLTRGLFRLGNSDVKISTNVHVDTKKGGTLIQMPTAQIASGDSAHPQSAGETSTDASPDIVSSSTDFSDLEPVQRTGDSWGLPFFVKVGIVALILLILFLISKR